MESGAARLGRVAGLCGVGGRGQVGVRWLQGVEISESGVGGGCEVEARERAISGEEVGLTERRKGVVGVEGREKRWRCGPPWGEAAVRWWNVKRKLRNSIE